MKYEYVAIVTMGNVKYNAILMCGKFGSKRTVKTLEDAQKALDSYVGHLDNVKLKYDSTVIKKRQVTEWEEV